MYITVMFPYPSGSGLHVGHWYNYAIVDSYCRLQRYLGHKVFQPIGFDSFGLPAENYARKVGRDPKDITYENIEKFRQEMTRMNTQFEELLVTSDPEYQKWTQWIFQELLQEGLAYQKFGVVNYCPDCNTVLANEQVKEDRCERCETLIEKRELNQWYFKITDYKDRLIKDLDKVDYPEKTKKQQIHWLSGLSDWCVSRQRKWGCPIPVDGEDDTLDTFVDSSFYTIRYCDPKNTERLCDFDKARPVDLYVGGNEHACMHLIYARFITKFLYDKGYIPFDEPFKKVIHQGMITNEGQKMSKSKGNTVDCSQYDPQVLRMYLMFINHYFEGGSWSDQNIRGCERFIRRFYNWMDQAGEKDRTEEIKDFKKRIINFFESWKTNKIVSEFMVFYNEFKNEALCEVNRKELREFFEVLFPKNF